jgi:hypothetical protein
MPKRLKSGIPHPDLIPLIRWAIKKDSPFLGIFDMAEIEYE